MDIKEIRQKINDIDEDLLPLFIERMKAAEEVAKYKRENGLPVYDPAREREILAKVTEDAGEYEPYAYHLYTTLFKLSKARQSEVLYGNSEVCKKIEASISASSEPFPRTGIVACQGIEGANSQAASEKLIPRGNIIFVKSFEAVFDAVESGLCKFGILPIENSSNGSVRAVYELMRDRKVSVVRSTRLCIRHELLVKSGTKLSDIKKIYSHEQAIGQCSKFIASLGKAVEIIPCANTAVAAKLVSETSDGACAAISSHRCAEIYGLETVKDDIQNSDNNYTRFICITKDPVIYEGSDRISLVFSCDNRPGALYDILSKPAVLGINMSKLESCPVSGRNFEFMFFLELDCSVKEKEVLPMLADIERSCESLTFLGSYEEV